MRLGIQRMDTAIDFASLIITYNSANEIGDLLSDLRRLTWPDRHRVIVIDNRSQDDTVQIVRRRFPEVCLIENSRNLGFAKAVNQGMDVCEAGYVFLLNPDLRIVQEDFHQMMLACIQQSPTIAAVGPLQSVQTRKGRRLNWNWSYCNAATFSLFVSHWLKLDANFSIPLSASFLNCGCLLLRKSAFLSVGKLNENYFLYGEEPDLFLKFTRAGYESRLLPSAEVIHHRDRSLNTLPAAQQFMLRLRGLCNIGDALVRGYARLTLARLSGGKSR